MVVNVVDAAHLDRDLFLTLQLAESCVPMVVALNLIDEARRHGLTLNHRKLARVLGVPVVPMVARSGEGVGDLVKTVAAVAASEHATSPRRLKLKDRELDRTVSGLARRLEAMFPGLPNARWVALRLLDGDKRMTQAVLHDELLDLVHRQSSGLNGEVAVEIAAR